MTFLFNQQAIKALRLQSHMLNQKSDKIKGNRGLVSFVNFNRPKLLISKFNIGWVYFQYITLNFVELSGKIVRQNHLGKYLRVGTNK